MSVKPITDLVDIDQMITKEYNLVIDGVVELEMCIDKKTFFDGLLDTVIEYIEAHNALAALTISHNEYHDLDIEVGNNGRVPA